MSTIITVAELVAAYLESLTLSQSFTVARSYQPEYELPDLDDLTVTVVPATAERAMISRGADEFSIDVECGIVQRITAGDSAELDALMALVEELADAFRALRLGTTTVAVCVNMKNAPVYDPDVLREEHLFTSLITFTFVVYKAG